MACEVELLGWETNSAALFQSPAAADAAEETQSGVLLFHADLAEPRLREHRALLLWLVRLARFGLFDQLNAAVEEVRFLLLSAALPRISNTCTQTHLHMCMHKHLLVLQIFLVAYL